MGRYAQLLNGKVVDVREADSLGQLALIFGPQTYWIDVTNVDCEIGYVTRVVEGAGVIYVDPNTPEPIEEIQTVEQAREYKMIALKREYLAERDKFRWVTFREAKYDEDLLISSELKYGFECDPQNIINFIAAMIPVLFNGIEEGTIDCLAWFDNGTKGIVSFTPEEMKKIYMEIRQEQMMVNIKYNEKKALVKSLTNIDKIMAVQWDDEEEKKE